MDKIEKGDYIDFGEHQGIVESIEDDGGLQIKYNLSKCFDDPEITTIWMPKDSKDIKVVKARKAGDYVMIGDWKGVIKSLEFGEGRRITCNFYYCRDIKFPQERWNFSITVFDPKAIQSWEPEI